MFNPQEIRFFRRALVQWYGHNARDLPWRRTRDPYLIWLSEIILQQTRVEQGLPYFERFSRAFPNVQALAGAAERQVLRQWEGLGYYARARNMHKAARVIVTELGGVFPKSAAEWMRLPGVGRYTAGAITSIAFNEPVPVLDGNVARVLARLMALDAPPGAAATRLLWQSAETLVPHKRPGTFNQALMELGAQVCIPRKPLCDTCPVKRACHGFSSGEPGRYPVRRSKRTSPHHHMALAVISRNGRYLVQKRPDKGLLAGLWEFPSVHIDKPEDAMAAVKELASSLGFNVHIERQLSAIRHAFTHFCVTVYGFICTTTDKTPRTLDVKWLRFAQLDQYPLPKFLRRLLLFV